MAVIIQVELQAGSMFFIDTWNQETGWEEVPCISEVCWDSQAWIISRDDTTEWEVNWNWIYGELPPGRYRIGKEIMDFRETGDYDTSIYFAEFQIE